MPEVSTLHQAFDKIHSPFIEALPDFGDPKVLAQHIQKLSTQYIERKTDLSKIWESADLAKAYLGYFLPLNLIRLEAIAKEAQARNFFAGLDHLVDFGSGPGTAHIALQSYNSFQSATFIESSLTAQNWHKRLLETLNIRQEGLAWVTQQKPVLKPNTLVTFSYALNEISQLPDWALQAKALLFLEPSTQEAGRNLQLLRQKLIEKGFHVWAPCTHQMPCPLLQHSKTDWCHNRIHATLSKRLEKIETHLPIKNQTLTYSYLLMRRDPPLPTTQGRVIGDTLYERGKVRQAYCRGDKREFLTWLTRFGEPTPLPRGTRLQLPPDAEEKGSEIRMPAPKA